MSHGSVAFLIGVLVLTRFPVLPGPVLLSFLCFCFCAALACCGRHLAILLAWFLAGFLWAALHAYWYTGDLLDSSLQGVDRLVSGQVVSLVQLKKDSIRFVFRPDDPDLPTRISVTWYEGFLKVQPGERWRLELRLKRPRGSANFDGFDYEAWALRQRLGATAYVRNNPENLRLIPAGSDRPILLLRSRLQKRIANVLSDHPMQGFIAGLSIGVRDAVTPEQWRVLTATGTNHLMAISGLHIGLVAGLIFTLTRFVWALLFPFSRLSPTRGAICFSFMTGLTYALLAGFSIPTRRALLMLSVVLGAGWFRRRIAPTHSLGLAVIGVLVIDPLAVLSSGFWLSFGAVAFICWSFLGREKANRANDGPVVRLVSIQWAVFVGLLPLTLLLYRRVSLAAPLVNLILVPLFGVLVIPLCLLGILLLELWPSVGAWLVTLCADLLSVVWFGMEFVAGVSSLLVVSHSLPFIVIVTTLLGVVLVLLPTAWPGKWLGLVLMMPMWVYQPIRPQTGEFELTVLDVGQGLSVVVMTAEHTLVYDTGNAYPSGNNAGERLILPFLQSRGVKHIDLLVLSHGDRDHTGGAQSLMDDLPVNLLLLGNDDRLTDRFAGGEPCVAGQTWRWSEVQIEVIHPAIKSDMTANNGSCVIKITSSWGSALLPGDIEAAAEVSMLSQNLSSDVVLAPHHGSDTSSRLSWVRATGAEIVVFSAPYDNHWGFPKTGAFGRWRSIGATSYCTGTSGALRVSFGSSARKVQEWRRFSRRFWRPWAFTSAGCK